MQQRKVRGTALAAALNSCPARVPLRGRCDVQARLEVAQAQLASSIGLQGALVWALEGGRDVVQVATLGAAFLLTGNLAAPLAANLASQLVVSSGQRLGLTRLQRRQAERRAAAQRHRADSAASKQDAGEKEQEEAGV